MKRWLLGLLTMLSVAAVQLPAVTHAAGEYDIKNQVCQGIDSTGACTDTDDGLNKIIGKVINVMSIIVGSVAVIMVIVGGFRYIVSGGDSNAVASAKNTIIYAIVGLVIALLAQAIVRFAFRSAIK